MKQKKWFITMFVLLGAIILVLTGLLIAGTITNKLWFTNYNNSLEGVEPVEKIHHSIADLNELSIRTSSVDCNIYISDNDVLEIELISDMSENKRSKLYQKETGNKLSIVAKRKQVFGFFIGKEVLNIYLPREYYNDFQVVTSSGRITCDDRLENNLLNLKSSSGNISITSIEAPRYSVEGTSSSVKIGTITGNGTVTTSSGSIKINSLNGDNHNVSSTSGKIDLGEVSGNIVSKTSSASIRIDRLNGSDHDITSTSGKIELGVISGKLFCRTSSGRISIDSLSGNLKAESTSGSVRVASMEGHGMVDTSSGSIDLSAMELNGDLTVHSTSGKIQMDFKTQPSAEIKVDTTSGRISSNFLSVDGQKHVTAKTGTGEHYISVSTSSGSITINDQ